MRSYAPPPTISIGQQGADTVVFTSDFGIIARLTGISASTIPASAFVHAAAGTDTFYAHVDTSRIYLYGTDWADALTGTAAAEGLYGGADADRLDGAGGNDLIVGGVGDDVLIGGLGADTLTGGAGADTFLYQTVDDSTLASGDVITDFTTAADHIHLAALSPNFVTIERRSINGVTTHIVSASDNQGHVLRLSSSQAVAVADVLSGGTEVGRMYAVYGSNGALNTQQGYDSSNRLTYQNSYNASGAIFEQDTFDVATGARTGAIIYAANGTRTANTYSGGYLVSQTGIAADGHTLVWANSYAAFGVLASQAAYSGSGLKTQQIDFSGDGGRVVSIFSNTLYVSQTGLAADGHKLWSNAFDVTGRLAESDGFDASGAKTIEIDYYLDGTHRLRTFSGSIVTMQKGYAADGHQTYGNVFDATTGALTQQLGYSLTGVLASSIDYVSGSGRIASHYDAAGSLTDTTWLDGSSTVTATLVRDPGTTAYIYHANFTGLGFTAVPGQGQIELVVGGASDTLTFGSGFGRADVFNFSIDLSTHDVARIDHSLAADFAALMAHAQTVGNDTVISFDGQTALTLHGLHADQLQAYDFLFY